jgi:transposase
MSTKKKRKIYTTEFKVEALKLAERIGVTAAAKELSVYDSPLYNWRAALQKKASTSQREVTLAAEVARLKRQLADQTEDLAILKKRQPTSRRTKNKTV